MSRERQEQKEAFEQAPGDALWFHSQSTQEVAFLDSILELMQTFGVSAQEYKETDPKTKTTEVGIKFPTDEERDSFQYLENIGAMGAYSPEAEQEVAVVRQRHAIAAVRGVLTKTV